MTSDEYNQSYDQKYVFKRLFSVLNQFWGF